MDVKIIIKKVFTVVVISLFAACSTKSQMTGFLASSTLCNKVAIMENYINDSQEIKNFFGSESLRFKNDTIITDGFLQLFLDSKYIEVLKKRNGISTLQAEKILYSRKKKEMRADCIYRSFEYKPDLNIHYYYYPEADLLAAEIINIIDRPGYRQGWVLLGETNSKGEFEIIASSFWEE